MYNEQNIYLHDTNAKSRFNSEVRAASHGCIRTKNVLDLATMLLGDDGGEWTPDKIAETLAAKKTKQANFVKPLPVYIVYFSVAANNDGSIVNYTDMYKRDGKVIEALLDEDGKGPPVKKAAEKVATK
jgi:murein L,D-transpeptidase YcbB/YkuD